MGIIIILITNKRAFMRVHIKLRNIKYIEKLIFAKVIIQYWNLKMKISLRNTKKEKDLLRKLII
jgi:hypothetical protein